MFDHNGRNRKKEYPGVAQLAERLVWDQGAAGSNPVTRSEKAVFAAKKAAGSVALRLYLNCNLFFKHVTLETLAKICIALQCGISDIVEIKWEKQ